MLLHNSSLSFYGDYKNRRAEALPSEEKYYDKHKSVYFFAINIAIDAASRTFTTPSLL